jgi:hypothetical protein
MTTSTIKIDAQAEYQLFSDMTGEEWARAFLTEAVEARTIEEYRLLNVATGAFGLQLVTFVARLEVPEGNFDDIKAKATDALNGVVHDTDIDVRWVSLAP